jgi:hypothetical protein
MSNYVIKEQVIEIPKSTGIDGFLLVLGSVLKLPRVSDINIEATGVVKVKRWLREEELADSTIQFDFDSVSPYSIIRNGEVQDVGFATEDKTPLWWIGHLFLQAQQDHMHCVSFVTGADVVVFNWCAAEDLRFRDELFGLPVLRDRFIDDDVLLLCTSYGQETRMVDVRKSYKLTLPTE